jgi:hypothetical protein
MSDARDGNPEAIPNAYRRAVSVRIEAAREARREAALDQLQTEPKAPAPYSRPHVPAVLLPFVWLGGRIALSLAPLVARRRKRRRAKERQRSRGERAAQLRKTELRGAKKGAHVARLARASRADRQDELSRRSPDRSPPQEPPRPH